ncbi:expressed unknown protein [Seminavis robusta]|uniref:Uncharacterized protein n=1 Tax=Seminavis robusta TaxID=568900 RepID=A0A9N8DRL6_9STRA|nr:expressed unknown protein [Seminavis robusta]|eukprot:Sro302_g112140.1 n/a (465) ;mRNA; r:7001-8395
MTTNKVLVSAIIGLVMFMVGWDMMEERTMKALDFAGVQDRKITVRNGTIVHEGQNYSSISANTTSSANHKSNRSEILRQAALEVERLEADKLLTKDMANFTDEDKEFLGIIPSSSTSSTNETTESTETETTSDSSPNSTTTESLPVLTNEAEPEKPVEETSNTDKTTTEEQQSTSSLPPPSLPRGNMTDNGQYNHSLTLEDYYQFAEPGPPSKQWLQDCAATLGKDKSIVKEFPTLLGEYALGDCIKACNKCNLGLPGKQKKIFAPDMKHHKNYNLTIAGYYSELACPHKIKNFTILNQVLEIFGQRDGFVKPDPTDVVMHLRLGDVLDYSPQDVVTMLTRGGQGFHPQARKKKLKTIFSVYDYYNLLHEKHPGSKLIIIGGSHKPWIFEKSRTYANCLQRGLARAGIQVDMQLDNGDADKDFYFMSFAQYFMISTGGFSRFIEQMIKLHGGWSVGYPLDTKFK